MQSFAAASMLLVGVVTLVVGGRLLLAGARSRRLPEIAFGMGFVSGSLGVVLPQLGNRFWWTEPGPFAEAMNAGCLGFMVIGTFFLYLVVWRVFRPESLWAAALCAVGTGLAAVAWGIRLGEGSFTTNDVQTSASVLLQVDRLVLFAWSASEGLLEASKLRRRGRLGLADPIATLQIGLWGWAGVLMVATSALIVAYVSGWTRHPLEIPLATLALTIAGLGTSAFMWGAFFPPAWLQRRAHARGAEPA